MPVAFTGFLGTEWTATITGDVTASNFDGGALPGAGTDVVVGGTGMAQVADISDSTYQNYSGVPVATYNLEILAGATVNANASRMTIHGALVNHGAFNVNTDVVKVLGAIDNDGLLTVDGDHGASFLLLDSGDFTLTGTGNLRLASETDGTAYLSGRDGELTILTNQSRISGTGYIGQSGQIYYPGGPLAIHNEGIIDANVSGRDLVIAQGTSAANPMLNSGSLVANGGGRLIISEAQIEQSGSGVIGAYGAGSSVQLAAAIVQGGFLDSSDGGTIELQAGGYGGGAYFVGTLLDGSSSHGAVTITETALVRIGLPDRGGQAGAIKGSIVNLGEIAVNGYQSDLYVGEGGATLSGGGEVHLSESAGGGGNDGGARLLAAPGTEETVLTNVDNLIHGAGTIGKFVYWTYSGGWEIRELSVVNQVGGTIQADHASHALVISQTLAFDNNGLLRAIDGARLQVGDNVLAVDTTDIDNQGGRILADGAGSTVDLLTGTIRGGTVGTANGGAFRLLNGDGSVLDGSTAQGAVTVTGAVEIHRGMLRGDIINNGRIEFDDERNAQLIIAKEGATFSGGVIALDSTNSVNHFIIGENAEATAQLTNAGTIEGSGYIGSAPAGGWETNFLTLNNTVNGVVRALAGGTIVIDTSGTIVNEGVLQADGGTLEIRDLVTGNGVISATNGGTLKVQYDWSGKVAFQGATVETLTRGASASAWAAGAIAVDGFGIGDIIDLGYANGLYLGSPNTFRWTQSGGDGTMSLDLFGGEVRDFSFAGLTQTHLELVDNGMGGFALIGRAVTEGSAQADTFNGTGGDDRLVGYGGNDLFRGTAGDDIFDGGDGQDSVTYADATEGVAVNLGNTGVAQQVSINQGSDIFRFIENIVGSNFADTIQGDAAGNALSGNKGKDILIGDAGNDRLIGGAGADDLTGGADADRFVYLSVKDSTVKQKGQDIIHDFNRAEKDKIDLSAIDANSKASHDQDFSFIGKKDFSGKAGQLRFEKTDDGSYVYGDVNGDRKADFAIHFDDALSFKGADFML
ncbi:MAG: hypothetical protein KDJ87_03535 [Rhizobiaceae bacterium]|nr:hypothetical protein [Rhizobiaceae bacterium]